MADSSDATTAPYDGQGRDEDDKPSPPAGDDDSKGLEEISSDEDEESYADPNASSSKKPASEPPSSPLATGTAEDAEGVSEIAKDSISSRTSAAVDEALPLPKDDVADKPDAGNASEGKKAKGEDVAPSDVALKSDDRDSSADSVDAVDSVKRDTVTDARDLIAEEPEEEPMEVDPPPSRVEESPTPMDVTVEENEEAVEERANVEAAKKDSSGAAEALSPSSCEGAADKAPDMKKVTESVDEVDDATPGVDSPMQDAKDLNASRADNPKEASDDESKGSNDEDLKEADAKVCKVVGREVSKDHGVEESKDASVDDSKDSEVAKVDSVDDSNDLVSNDVDEEGSKDVNDEVSKDVNDKVSKDVDDEVSKDVDDEVSKDVDDEVSNDADEVASKDVGEGVSKNAEVNISKDAFVENSKDTDSGDVKDSGDEVLKDVEVDSNDEDEVVSKNAIAEESKVTSAENSKDASIENSKVGAADDMAAADDVTVSKPVNISSRPPSVSDDKDESIDGADAIEMITAEVEMGDIDMTEPCEDSRPTSSSSKSKEEDTDERMEVDQVDPEVAKEVEPGDVVEQIETGSGPVIIKVCAIGPGQDDEEEGGEKETDKAADANVVVSAAGSSDKGETSKGDCEKKKVDDVVVSNVAVKLELVEGEDGGDGVAASTEGEDMPALAIMDVRTVTDEEAEATAAAEQGESSAGAKAKPKPKGADDSEMKNYAADTMNELLGLFGYEKVDETMKDAIQLSNNLSGPGEKGGLKLAVKKVGEGSPAVAVKSGQGRTCSVCGKTRSCKYQVLMLGTTKFLCDDNCFREFRTKQNITAAPAIKDIIAENRPITRSLTHPKDHCNQCHKEIRNGQGLLPGVGENKPLCSEECMRTYQAAQGLKRGCAQCGCQIQSRSKCLTWEAMEFCNEECLGKYQSYLGSHCAYCNHAVQQTSLGKYCVRFGSDIKQFCSNGCLEEFKKGLKVCSYCQKDISSGTEGFLAPVGDKGQFKEFCSQSCMEKYETMGNVTPIQPTIEQCSVCNKVATVKVEVTFDAKVHKLCSEPCIAAFRYANKINTSICDTCHKFFDLDVSRQLTIQFEGTSKRFCTKACMNVFVLYHRKVVPCSWCKVKKYNFDMIERVDSNNHVQLFCSLNCLSLFRVSLNATSSRKVQCDFCHHSKPAQYHLTMSDASIRNFCSYNCVMQFQGQFTTLAPVVNAPTAPGTAITTTNTQTTGTPVISSVMSLAPAQGQVSATQTVVAAPKSIIIRPQTSLLAPVAKPVIPVRAMSTQTMVPAITQQVLVRNPPAKAQKNKTLMCKPMTQTKGVSCKPHPCHKTTQTEEDFHKPFLIPVPVPIFVPVPMRMFTTPVPYPLPFPLPIPVPVFIPTTRNSAQGIFKQIREIQHKIPDNPFEADLILMAEMVADEESSAKDGGKSGASSKLKAIGAASPSSNLGSPEPDDEGGFPIGTHLPDGGGAFGDDVLQMALRMASGMDEPVDLETALAAAAAASEQQHVAPVLVAEENGASASYLSPRELRGQTRNHNKRSASGGGRGRGRGRKRARTSDRGERDRSPPPSPQAPILAPQFDMMAVGPPRLESNCVLKYSYGVNAWKHWVVNKNTQLEKASQSNRKLKLFKTDLLQLVADELNYSLCLFVKEVRKPNGEEYAPDSIYYLCLGIQQYLFENGRIDNIFADAYYEKFTECLNEVLQRYDITIASDGCFISRIEEEILWECKQLGAHSPHVLLNTLMYFNTKFFMLKTIDEHLQLSFTHILKHWKKTPGAPSKASAAAGRNVLLRYYPTSSQTQKDTSRKRKESTLCYEQVENLENPLRCPVKLYEFYLSKCPESIKNRSDVFYLYPERSCVPDSPVWYSTMSLGKETIAKMLQRIRMVSGANNYIAQMVDHLSSSYLHS